MTQSRIRLPSRRLAPVVAACAALAGCATGSNAVPTGADIARLEAEVAATETAFAATMAQRNFNAFAEFIAVDAVFFSGPEPLRGKDAVTGWWRRFYTGAAAPFAWQPETVRVIASGGLAISTGPVTDGSGQLVSTYTSIWRREDGRWRIVFDRGNDVCRCAAAP